MNENEQECGAASLLLSAISPSRFFKCLFFLIDMHTTVFVMPGNHHSAQPVKVSENLKALDADLAIGISAYMETQKHSKPPGFRSLSHTYRQQNLAKHKETSVTNSR